MTERPVTTPAAAPKKRRNPADSKRNEEALRTIATLVSSAYRFDTKSLRETLDKVGDVLVEGGWL